MDTVFSDSLFSDWSNELAEVIKQSNSLCVAVFSENRELLFANKPMQSLLKSNAVESLLNPSFEKLLSLENSSSLIFEGDITIGDLTSINPSIRGQVYRKNRKILISGGVHFDQLFEQNLNLHAMNREVNSLQRILLKERSILKQTLTDLNRANDELKAINETKEKFFSIIAHDLRSPFNGFLGLTQVLVSNLHNLEPEAMQNALVKINQSAVKLFELLENLLAWSSMQQLTIEVVKENCVLKHVVDDCMALMSETAHKKDVVLQSDLTDKIVVVADRNMLRTIIRNLVSNAIKYSHAGGVVQVNASPSDGAQLTFSISDTGIGMKQQIIDSLFEVSRDKSQSGTAGELSTGLGLMLCKDFIDKMDGTLFVESEVGKGSVFSVTLPNGDYE